MRGFGIGMSAGAMVGAALALTGGATLADGHTQAAASGQAAAHPAGGRVELYFTPEGAARAGVLAVGAIGDYGTGVPVDRNGHHDPQGQFERVTLKRGSFTIDWRAFSKKIMQTQPRSNSQTCSFELKGQGPAVLLNGSGLYAGITGTLTGRSTLALIHPRSATGSCRNDASPVREYSSTTAAGNVRFGK